MQVKYNITESDHLKKPDNLFYSKIIYKYQTDSHHIKCYSIVTVPNLVNAQTHSYSTSWVSSPNPE